MMVQKRKIYLLCCECLLWSVVTILSAAQKDGADPKFSNCEKTVRKNNLQCSEKLLGFSKFTCVSSITIFCMFMNQIVHNQLCIRVTPENGQASQELSRLSPALVDLLIGTWSEASCADSPYPKYHAVILPFSSFTPSRAQGNVDKILARWRPDLSATVEEAGDTLRGLAQRIVNEQREYAH